MNDESAIEAAAVRMGLHRYRVKVVQRWLRRKPTWIEFRQGWRAKRVNWRWRRREWQALDDLTVRIWSPRETREMRNIVRALSARAES